MKRNPIPSSEITPEHVFLSRRKFMRQAVALTAGALGVAACLPTPEPLVADPTQAPAQPQQEPEIPDTPNTYEEITNYNNFYEFTMDKAGVAALAKDFVTSPWQVSVEGLVNKPGVYDIDALRKDFDQEERIYRLRCVEGWSMVIPWLGFPLSKLLKLVEPTGDAKYVRFTTLDSPEQFPGQVGAWYSWPYVEGLRLDEAMQDLTLLATGIYGKDLLPQNGAPVRLVVPWKYGFYANVNPDVPHPRWSQSTERRLGTSGGRMATLFLNGYADEVGSLYQDMDLKANF